MSELQLKEVREVVRKARASSAPGPSGTSYKVYKYCPKLLLRLWYILRVFWRRGRIPDQWRVAEGVWIPKEENSTQLDQFRIISLLCVEAKVFFSAVSKRLCTYLAENTYIDTSVQKGGISGMPGCLEHTGVVTQLIREARENKGNLSVLWLDLENAFGSIPHKLVQFTLTKHHVPSRCRDLIADYYSNFRMRVSSGAITSSWHKVEIGIITGCTISVTLFSLAMNMLTKSAEPECRGPRTNSGQRQPPIRAFMDDLTVMTESVPGCRWILKGLEELVEWARMRFKPAKSRSMVLRKGKVVDKFRFNIADTAIPSISEKPVKSLGKVFDCSLRDTTSIQSTCTELDGWLKSVDKSGLPGKFKAWVYQHGILPRILWPLLVYAVPISTVETLERRVEKVNCVIETGITVSEEANSQLEGPLTIQELQTALQGMQGRQAPGIDGLSVEFYRAYWDVLSNDLLDVFNESLASGSMPVSCRRAVITLLPKKGNLQDIKNWRPVSLLCVDYKLLSKALATRLGRAVEQIIHRDQTYCVPGRSMVDNVHLIRDVLEVSSSLDINTGLISLDQEKAFDRVEHSFLWKVMEKFGFSAGFIAKIMVLYNNIESVLKFNGGLCAPFRVCRGVRQGCALSGMLYALSLEPLLNKICSKLQGLFLPGFNGNLVLSAYADDVVVFVRDQTDIDVIVDIVREFSSASSARVNWKKSEALAVGEWSGGLQFFPRTWLDVSSSETPGLTVALCRSKTLCLQQLVDAVGPELSDAQALGSLLGLHSVRVAQRIFQLWSQILCPEEKRLLRSYGQGGARPDPADPFPEIYLSPGLGELTGPLLQGCKGRPYLLKVIWDHDVSLIIPESALTSPSVGTPLHFKD
ncbi:hypothetical protein NHX12_002336 [Muraenolepis orangiensis]|uniref:Reverse transcriptase domain-containing protein n=2 Tax=Muraenolepis orangiensis TaxID=630683 RepID=A0A9Q0DU88_9TELE|nr:hypothetical protein NHX12_002336 [Muraenolepis orangiensis]